MMKNNKAAKQRNEETEEDKKIIDIVCKLGGGFVKEKNDQKIKKNKYKHIMEGNGKYKNVPE